MRVSEIGEFGLIERLKRRIKTDSTVIKGSGDDCAVLKFDKTRYQLFTCDTIAEGVDFKPDDNPYFIGRKSLAVSLSDIASCAGLPRYCLVSMSLPKDTPVSFIDRIMKGIIDVAGEYGVNIVGGDLSKAKELSITTSVLGIVEKKFLCLRSSAKTGDLIFVTGKLGGSIRGKHLKFNPRIKEARELVKNIKVNSMIDISDGLSGDLWHILRMSKAGAFIYEELIPVNKGSDLHEALYMGEDFELLFTISLKEALCLRKKRIAGITAIGEIVERKNGLKLVDRRGKIKAIGRQGYSHF
jgi:thiamine-monophosphate kinase